MLFSIIIPVYNVGKYLIPCLESVSNQAVQDWECILVDDGSSDGSEKICDIFAEKDSRFKVFHRRNGGVSAARNIGLTQAMGEWIWLVDADDLLHPQALKIITDTFTKHNKLDLIYFNFSVGENISFNQISNTYDLQISQDKKQIPEMSPCGCIFRKVLSENLTFSNYVVGEDLLFFARVLVHVKKFAYIPLPLYGYIMRQSSVTHSAISFKHIENSICWMKDILFIYFRHQECFAEKIIKRRFNQFFFALPFRIFSERIHFQELSFLWFNALESLPDMKINVWIKIWRNILLYSKKILFLSKIFIILNAMIFYSYAKFLNRKGLDL